MLWSLFYEDAAISVQQAGFTEVVYADDFNAIKENAIKTAYGEALSAAKECQENLHTWFKAN